MRVELRQVLRNPSSADIYEKESNREGRDSRRRHGHEDQ
jgi:hypothetical protein